VTEHQNVGKESQTTGSGGGAKASGTGGGVGTGTDAVIAFGDALVKAAEAKPASTADPLVSAAFALGWHMSELYEKHRRATRGEPPDLPSLSSLTEEHRIFVLVDQVTAGVAKLKEPIAHAGLPPIDFSEVERLGEEPTESDVVLEAHERLLGELTAADFRLGKAYGLGRALADSCREPNDFDTLKAELKPQRIANLLRWLDDLATAFPPHAAHSVGKSLMKWRDFLYPSNETRASRPRRLRKVAVIDPQEAIKLLGRQGELWRGLLSGEKHGTDMLAIDDYLDAARAVASHAAAVLRGAVVRMPLLALLILALVGVGVWQLVEGSSSHLVAGVISVLAAVGLTWKGIGGALGRLVGKLEQPLWGAVLDDAIADAITLPANNTGAAVGRREVALAERDEGRNVSPAP
jgi:hypothetical protein